MNQTRRLDSSVHQRALALSLLLVIPCATRAENTEDVKTYLISIHSLYESLEYERALEQTQLARQLPRSTEEEVTRSLYEGILQCELGREEQGTAAFKAALLLRPDSKLPVQVAPKIERRFESVRQQVKREFARLRVEPSASPSTAVVTQPPATPPSAASLEASAHGALRRKSLIPAVAGGTLLVAGGISWAISRGTLNQLRTNDPRIATREDVQRNVSRGNTWQTVGISLLGAGAAGLVTAAGMYVLGSPDQPVSLGVSTDGTSAFVHGRWP
ncbi:hypothetical protein JRI60_18640 [Archangium violaceum]|nr:hypothetical protein JRI60_18640 [Archangium violaceum]